MTDKSVDPDLVRQLAGILRESELTEIEVEHDKLRVRLTRKSEAADSGKSAAKLLQVSRHMG